MWVVVMIVAVSIVIFVVVVASVVRFFFTLFKFFWHHTLLGQCRSSQRRAKTFVLQFWPLLWLNVVKSNMLRLCDSGLTAVNTFLQRVANGG